MKKPNILVTGGTGFVGEAVIRELSASGFSIRVLTRHASHGHRLRNIPGVEIVEADIYQSADVANVCQGVQAIIHLVGIIHQTFADPFEKVHVAATRAVVEGAKMAGVQRYIHMSALGTREEARSQYHRTKWEAEKVVRGTSLNWTIFRPSLIFGAGDGFVNLFAKLLRFPLNILNAYTFPLLGGGTSLFQPIAVKNVAEVFVRSLSREESIHQTYDLCGEERLSLTSILEEIVLATGQKFQVENFPFLVISRLLIWLLALVIPVLLLAGVILFHLGLFFGISLLLLWVVLVAVVLRWKSIILFNLPWPLAFLVAVLIQNIWIFGKPLLTVDQLIMLQEGNVGNEDPAKKLFDMKLQGFREGIRVYLEN